MPLPIPSPNRIQNLLTDLVSLKSVTGTYGEDDILEYIEGYIKRHSNGGIELHRLVYELEAGGGVPQEKWSLVAIKRGKGRDGLLLAGHVDTIGTGDYGFMEPVATQPEKLLASLRAEIDGRRPVDLIDNRPPLSPLATEHVAKDDYFWGRGSLDMKSGVAAMIETLLAWEEEDPTLVLLLTPDEEGDSSGIKSALPQLGLMLRRAKINLLGAVGTDFWEPPAGVPAKTRHCHTGFIGKVLVGIYYRAATGHVSADEGAPSTLRLGSRLVDALEGCEFLREERDGVPLPPPMMLRATDLRKRYDTRLPGEFWGYLHVPIARRKPKEVLEIVRTVVGETIGDFYAEFAKEGGAEPPEISLLDVPTLVEKPYNYPEGEDLREVCRDKFLASAIYQRVRAPWAIVGLIPPMYPSYFWNPEKFKNFDDALGRALERANKDMKVGWERRPFYPNVHDLSLLVANREAWLQFIPEQPLKITRPKGLGVSALPVINLGTSGHGAHGPEERALIRDFCEVVPKTLSFLIDELWSDRAKGKAAKPKPKAKAPAKPKAEPKKKAPAKKKAKAKKT